MVTKEDKDKWDKWMRDLLYGEEVEGWICVPHESVVLNVFRDDEPTHCPIVYWGTLKYGVKRGNELREQCTFLKSVTRLTGEATE